MNRRERSRHSLLPNGEVVVHVKDEDNHSSSKKTHLRDPEIFPGIRGDKCFLGVVLPSESFVDFWIPQRLEHDATSSNRFMRSQLFLQMSFFFGRETNTLRQ